MTKAPKQLDEFLSGISDSISEQLEAAEAEVVEREKELRDAEGRLERLRTIMKAAKGELTAPTTARRPGTGSRAPRAVGAELQSKIKSALSDGKMPVAELLKKVGGEDQRVRNQLAQLVKKNEIKNHGGGVYSLSL